MKHDKCQALNLPCFPSRMSELANRGTGKAMKIHKVCFLGECRPDPRNSLFPGKRANMKLANLRQFARKSPSFSRCTMLPFSYIVICVSALVVSRPLLAGGVQSHAPPTATHSPAGSSGAVSHVSPSSVSHASSASFEKRGLYINSVLSVFFSRPRGRRILQQKAHFRQGNRRCYVPVASL